MTNSLRYEIKFILNEMNYSVFTQWITHFTNCTRKYSDRKINNLYFDDSDFNSVKDNLIGLPVRSKIRLRWYGDETNLFHSPILEEKFRKGRLGGKQHLPMHSLNGQMYNLHLNNINRKIQKYCNNSGNLISENYYSPSLYVNYVRQYYQDQNNFRITVDSEINFSIPLLSKKVQDLELLQFRNRVLEIKFNADQKYYASNLLKNLNLIPTRNSKYLLGLAMLGQLSYI